MGENSSGLSREGWGPEERTAANGQDCTAVARSNSGRTLVRITQGRPNIWGLGLTSECF